MAESITVVSEKPKLPTLWLDTSVGIKVAKVHRGEKLQDIETDRVKRLFEIVTRLVGEGKLLCPEADQDEEYEAERLEREIANEFRLLSLGIRLVHRAGILDHQIYYAMKAYCRREYKIQIPCEVYFHRDPVGDLELRRKQKFLFRINRSIPPELLEERRAAKEETVRRWEELRRKLVAEGARYQDQLDLELKSQADTMVEMVTAYMKKVQAGSATFSDFMGVSGWGVYAAYWKHLGCQPRGFDGLFDFLRSNHIAAVPSWSVNAKICADLMTGTEPISSSDPMDVELLSIAVPLAHYVLADRNMEARLKRLGLDREWGTQIFSMRTIDSLFAEIERL